MCNMFLNLYILSTAIAYLCIIDAKHFLNDPHSEKNAIMSIVFGYHRVKPDTDYTQYEYKPAYILQATRWKLPKLKKSVTFSSSK